MVIIFLILISEDLSLQCRILLRGLGAKKCKVQSPDYFLPISPGAGDVYSQILTWLKEVMSDKFKLLIEMCPKPYD